MDGCVNHKLSRWKLLKWTGKVHKFMVGVVMGVIVKLSFVWSSELMMFVYSVKTRNRRRTSLPIFVLTCYESKNVQVVFLSLTSLLFTQP